MSLRWGFCATMLAFVFLALCHVGFCFVGFQPEQIHLSYGETPYELVVTWSTQNNTKQSVVEYGIDGFVKRATGTSRILSHGKSYTQYIHRVTLPKLRPSSKYMYHVGSQLGWSELFFFHTPPPMSEWQPRLVLFGDMGNENPRSLPRLQSETQRWLYDAVIHIGDFAYDMNSENGRRGDQFLRQMQSIAAYVPYMTCAGNHEYKANFTDYRFRFNMPGGEMGSYIYSFDMGPVHFISINTEVYYFVSNGFKLITKQYEWLKKDLEEANKPEIRAKRPWIVVFGHRPMYCSNIGHRDCFFVTTRTRIGMPIFHTFGLEDLFYKNGVDLLLWAHEHSYERLWPIYNYTVYNGSYEEPYVNPRAPVHITTGSAGCKEKTTPFINQQPTWSAFRSTDYGYTRMKAYNTTHLYIEQVSDDKDGAIIDHIWLIKHVHHRSYEDLTF